MAKRTDSKDSARLKPEYSDGKGHFKNTDVYLEEAMPGIIEERKSLGLQGLVSYLDHIVINVEAEHQKAAVAEILAYTGYELVQTYKAPKKLINVLKLPGSADMLISSRLEGENRFSQFNQAPKARHLPNTRIEKFVFAVKDINRYAEAQRQRGTVFDDGIVEMGNYRAIHTHPSKYHGLSFGFVQWKGSSKGVYPGQDDEVLDWVVEKPDYPHLRNIGFLDHTATRVHAMNRDAAMLEFIGLTNYDFKFAIYLARLNSITSVARHGKEEFGMVFTSGISPYTEGEESGPTENYIRNYGTRVHHMAFATEKIDETYDSLKETGMKFMTELVGSKEQGLKQAFSQQSKSTILVNEYIHRFDGFEGFFTKENVWDLTEATGKQ